MTYMRILYLLNREPIKKAIRCMKRLFAVIFVEKKCADQTSLRITIVAKILF